MTFSTNLKKYTTDSKLKRISSGKVQLKSVLSDFDTTKNTYRAFLNEVLPREIPKMNITEFRKNMKLLKKLTNAVETADGISLNTKAKLYGEIRKMTSGAKLKALEGVLVLTKEESDLRQATSNKKVQKANRNQIIIQDRKISDFLRSLAYGSGEHKLEDAVVVLMLACGARMIEILNKKVSTFKKDPNDPAGVIQVGVAKMKGDKEVKEARSVHKPLIVITPGDFLELLDAVRSQIDDSGTNEQITNRYNARINKKLKTLLKKHKFPQGIGTSHDLRRLWANFTWKHRAPPGTSIVAWISDRLGHDPKSLSSASNFYSTINVETASILTENQAGTVNETREIGVANSDRLSQIEAGLSELKINTQKKKRAVMPASNESKFKKIERLISQGITSYSQLQKHGITTYMLSKYKKEKGLQGELGEKKERILNKTVQQASKELTTQGKTHTYANLRAYGFTNAEIKAWKSKQ